MRSAPTATPTATATTTTEATRLTGMDRTLALSLIDECLALDQARAPFMPSEEAQIPVGEYVDEARFARERDRIFRALPNLVAASTELAEPGAFLTRAIAGVPVVLIRGEDGDARAFINVCRHRGATVVLEDRGVRRRFACPYHAWTYDTKGALVVVPHSDGFPSLIQADSGLRSLPCFEASGFLWVVPSPSTTVDFRAFLTEELLAELAGFVGEGARVFASERRVYDSNWKIILDGGLESYHFRVAHRDTIGSKFIGNGSIWALLGDHVRSVLPRVSLRKLAERPRQQWDIRRCSNILYSIFPNTSVLVQSDHVALILAQPLTVDRTEIIIRTLVPPGAAETDEEKLYFQKNHELTVRALDEDFRLAEQIQTGLGSGANDAFRLARFESALLRVHEIIDRYSA